MLGEGCIQDKEVWLLSKGVLCVCNQVLDFIPFKAQSSISQVSVRFFKLPIEYWHLDVINGLFRKIGSPLKNIGNTISGQVEHFARAVELDMIIFLSLFLLIMAIIFFYVNIEYEALLYFCSFCSISGHSFNSCRLKFDYKDGNANDSNGDMPKPPLDIRSKIYFAILCFYWR